MSISRRPKAPVLTNSFLVSDFNTRHKDAMPDYETIWTNAALDQGLTNMEFLNQVGDIIWANNECEASSSDNDLNPFISSSTSSSC